VAVRRQVERGDPAPTLLSASFGATLLVLGARQPIGLDSVIELLVVAVVVWQLRGDSRERETRAVCARRASLPRAGASKSARERTRPARAVHLPRAQLLNQRPEFVKLLNP
jgi:hypothetical protein